MCSSGLVEFWSSIISDASFQEQVVSVMALQDLEERALALLSRTLFLLIMEIKFERDEAIRTSKVIREVITGCNGCRVKVTGDQSTHKTTTTTSTPSETEGNEDTRETTTGDLGDSSRWPKKRRKIDSLTSTPHPINNLIIPQLVINDDNDDSLTLIDEDDNLTSTPRQLGVNDDDVDDDLTPTEESNDILVPETLDIIENESLEEKTFITQKVFVAETVCMEEENYNYKPHNISNIFQDSFCEEIAIDTHRERGKKGNGKKKRRVKKGNEKNRRWEKKENEEEEKRESKIKNEKIDINIDFKKPQKYIEFNPQSQRNNYNYMTLTQQTQEVTRRVTTEKGHQYEYTEDVLVESDSVLRSLSKGRGHNSRSPGREVDIIAFRSPNKSTRSPDKGRGHNLRSPGREIDIIAFRSPNKDVRSTKNTLRSPNKHVRSPNKCTNHRIQSPSRVTPNKQTPSNKTSHQTPEGSPVFRKANRNKRTTNTDTTQAKRSISEALRTEKEEEEEAVGGLKVVGEVTTPHTTSTSTTTTTTTNTIKTPPKEVITTTIITASSRKSEENNSSNSHITTTTTTTTSPLPSTSPSPLDTSDSTSPSLLQHFGGGEEREEGRGRLYERIARLGGRVEERAGREKGRRKGGGGKEEEAVRGREEGRTRLGEREEARAIREEGRGRGLLILPPPPPPPKRFSLRRHHTTDSSHTNRQNRPCITNLHMSPPDPNRKKTGYRQTKVDHFLTQHSTATKHKDSDTKRVFLDDDEAFQLAVKESLADMEKKGNEEEGEEEEEEASSKVKSGSLDKASKPNKESPIKLPNLRPAQLNPIPAQKLPVPAQKSPRTERVVKKLIMEEEEEAKGKMIEGKNKIKTVIRKNIKKEEEVDKKEEGRGRGEVKTIIRRNTMKEEEEVDKKEEERRGEVKENMDDNSTGSKRKVKEEEEEEGRDGGEGSDKQPLKKIRKKLLHENFDVLPQEAEVGFAHQGEVVRKKAARMQLEGWSCKQCKEFYQKAGTSTQEVKELMNKCSRHRSKHKLLSNTPQGYWDPFL